MARRPGTRAERNADDDRPGGLLFSAGRFVGFALLAGMAMTILAGVVLVPAWAELAQTEYRLACEEARLADLQATIDAQQRLIDAIATDHVLARRLAISHLGLYPADEMVLVDADAPPMLPPGVVAPEPAPRPERPSPRLVQIAARLRRPARRRGLLLLATGMMVAALMLFSSPHKYPRDGDAE